MEIILERDGVVVCKVDDSEYEYVAIGTSYANGSSQLLRLDGFNGKVMYDSVLSNGFASNRYLEFVYADGKMDVNAVREVSSEDVPESVKRVVRAYWQEHADGAVRGTLYGDVLATFADEMGITVTTA